MRDGENHRFEAGVAPVVSALAQSLRSSAGHDGCHFMAVRIAAADSWPCRQSLHRADYLSPDTSPAYSWTHFDSNRYLLKQALPSAEILGSYVRPEDRDPPDCLVFRRYDLDKCSDWNPDHLPRRQAHGDTAVLRCELPHYEP